MTSLRSFDTHLGPGDAYWTFQQKGWTDTTLGLEWFKTVFLPNCGDSRPQLILLDSHSSHEVLELLELAKEEGIHIVALPPHTTQRLQPLDTNVFKPLKSEYSKACTDFLAKYPNRVIDKHSFPLMFAQAWKVMEKQEMIIKAFATTGIFPPNPAAISEDIYMSSTILSRPLLQDGAPRPSANASPTEEEPVDHQNIAFLPRPSTRPDLDIQDFIPADTSVQEEEEQQEESVDILSKALDLAGLGNLLELSEIFTEEELVPKKTSTPLNLIRGASD
ncbi:hypothetical protein PoB_000678200 [Plakobranchus ocellatus]|uniref:DDE-1 domain-containing protein n=1 Tax=Plakobranchus ocellatus TaxID=259542 RepID=A0AAV3YCT3_9GAST|nr:hypothetical protein PoB_000678200 [Plakobranchus ocellatus]